MRFNRGHGSLWGPAVDQVEDLYNGFGQLVQEYQAMSGAVSTSSTPSVQYSYTDAADGNNSRLTSIKYPDGYTVNYNYASGVDDTISRLTDLSDFTLYITAYPKSLLRFIQEKRDSVKTETNSETDAVVAVAGLLKTERQQMA